MDRWSSPGQHRKEDGVDGAIGSGTRRKTILTIEDAKTDGPKKSVIEELNEIPLNNEHVRIKNIPLLGTFRDPERE